MTKDEADRLAEGDRVKSRQLTGTVVGTTANCVSIQWDGRDTPEIFTTDDMRNVSRRERRNEPAHGYARLSTKWAVTFSQDRRR
jgi:hypothetical protein